MNGFSQQAFQITPGVLDLVKCSLDALTNSLEQLVKGDRVLLTLVSPFGSPEAIAGALTNTGLPVIAQKAFVTENIAILHPTNHGFGALSLIQISGNQVIDHGPPLQGRQHNQFV